MLVLVPAVEPADQGGKPIRDAFVDDVVIDGAQLLAELGLHFTAELGALFFVADGGVFHFGPEGLSFVHRSGSLAASPVRFPNLVQTATLGLAIGSRPGWNFFDTGGLEIPQMRHDMGA
jgi:hypothetical protein